MNRRQLIEAVVTCEALAREFRAALGEEARLEWEENQTAITWRPPGVVVTGPVSQPSVDVVDEPKFRAWVQQRYPHQIETVTRVFPAFQKLLLDQCAERGDPPHNDDGEIIPGLAYNPGGGLGALRFSPAVELKRHLEARAREMVAGSRPLALPGVEQ